MCVVIIKKNTSINEINSWLSQKNNNEITFKVLYESSFRLFSEGVALGALRTLSEARATINIQLYKVPTLNSDYESIHPLFKSIFGLELLRLSKKIYNNKGDEVDIRSTIGTVVWAQVQKDNGCIGDGKKIYLISRHGYEVPKCLREKEGLISFPRYDYFYSTITPYILSLRGNTKQQGISNSETKLIEWLHHIAENAYEHGSHNVRENSQIEGYRGILLGKYHFSSKKEYKNRKEFSEFVKSYISKLIKNKRIKNNNFTLNFISVMDIGDGIQSTLKGVGRDNIFSDLCMAFEDGVTRKAELAHETSGYGLGGALKVAADLNAVFLIVSGNIATVVDLTSKRSSYEFVELVSKPYYLSKVHGTSISLLWLGELDSNKRNPHK